MENMYITITGVDFKFGEEVFDIDTKVKLVKEPDNKYDKEAIKVVMEGLGTVGYVANSTNTVIGESMSAGRLYDKFEEETYARVLHILNRGIVCKIISKEEFNKKEKIPHVPRRNRNHDDDDDECVII